MNYKEKNALKGFLEELEGSSRAYVNKDIYNFATRTKGVSPTTMKKLVEFGIEKDLFYTVTAIEAHENKRDYKLRLPAFFPFNLKKNIALFYAETYQIRGWFGRKYLKCNNYRMEGYDGPAR